MSKAKHTPAPWRVEVPSDSNGKSISAVAELELQASKIEQMMNKERIVESNVEPAIVGNTVLAVRCYQIDFGNHLRCKIKVTDNGIEVEGAINGWGDEVPLSEVVVVEMQ